MIDVEGLQKAFGKKREVEAVRGVTFAAPDGEITGLLGPNGAGKTTLAADDCDARAAGRRPCARGRPRRRCRPVCRSRPHRRAVGCARPLSAADGARERRYFGRLYGLAGAALEARIDALFATLGMAPLADRRTGRDSRRASG
jgi:sodium transport system ATP-binding protein